jgi:hypothetical protein
MGSREVEKSRGESIGAEEHGCNALSRQTSKRAACNLQKEQYGHLLESDCPHSIPAHVLVSELTRVGDHGQYGHYGQLEWTVESDCPHSIPPHVFMPKVDWSWDHGQYGQYGRLDPVI